MYIIIASGLIAFALVFHWWGFVVGILLGVFLTLKAIASKNITIKGLTND